MHTIEVTHISKSFGSTQAVADVSFEIERGEIFGLLGPNGAGKTTILRILLDIFKPDSGSVSILGGAMTEDKKALIGYMPEERGLYQDYPLERCLLYLAALKGMPDQEAHKRLEEYFERFELSAYKGKKIKELSKGMQQKAQIISAILHQPELLIVDEPFSGLDPVNVHLAMDVLNEMHAKGTTIIMSTHQMHQVEELCDRILLIHHGKVMLYGNLDKIRRRFSGHEILVRSTGDLVKLSGVKQITPHNNALKLTLTEQTTPHEILQSMMAMDYPLEKFEIAIPSLDEIFVRVVEDAASSHPGAFSGG